MKDYKDYLKKFLEITPEIKGAIIFSRSGFIHACELPENVNEKQFLKEGSSFIDVGHSIIKQFGQKKINRIMINTMDLIFLFVPAKDHILMIAAESHVSLGLLFLNSKRVMEKFGAVESAAFEAKNKIISIMDEQGENKIFFERKFLSEIFYRNLWTLDSEDGLPSLRDSVEIQLKAEGIEVTYEGNEIIFERQV